jgi:hypothetical protein
LVFWSVASLGFLAVAALDCELSGFRAADDLVRGLLLAVDFWLVGGRLAVRVLGRDRLVRERDELVACDERDVVWLWRRVDR